jgi:hypothetical protein
MSKAFIAEVLQGSAELTGAAANRAAGDLMDAHRQGAEEGGQIHPAELRYLHGAQDQGAQGAEPAHRRGNQGQGRQDRPFQGLADAEKIGLRQSLARTKRG